MNKQRKTGLSGILTEFLGWIFIIAGIAALVLPGPGLLGLFAGVALLATRYEWAEKRLDPIKDLALKAAKDGVATWPRIIASVLGVFTIIAIAIYWGTQPPVPMWWPLPAEWWLPGGRVTAATMIGSAAIALTTIGYSYVRFRD